MASLDAWANPFVWGNTRALARFAASLILAIMILPFITAISPRSDPDRAGEHAGCFDRPRKHAVGDHQECRSPASKAGIGGARASWGSAGQSQGDDGRW